MKNKIIKFLSSVANKIDFNKSRINEKNDELKNSELIQVARLNSLLGPIPSLPEGVEGHEMLQSVFLALMNVFEPNIFCDIGANDGSISLAAKKESPGCRVLGFESNPRIYSNNAERLRKYGVEWINMAVSDESGRIPIFMPKTLSQGYVDGKMVPMDIIESAPPGKSSLHVRDEDVTCDRFDVDSVTLDGFFQKEIMESRNRSFFLWIDLEGSADKVLGGGKEILEKTLAVFVKTENFGFWKNQKLSHAIIENLNKRGFVAVARDREYDDKQFNILFIHESLKQDFRKFLRKRDNPFCHWLRGIVMTPHEGKVQSLSIPQVSVSGLLQVDIPILVPCFNNPTYVGMMIHQLGSLGFKNIILVDNASTSTEMKKYLSSAVSLMGLRTVLLEGNLGPRHCYSDEGVLALLPRKFCVTDPDIVFNSALPEGFLGAMAALAIKHRIGKVGFALDISDRHLMENSEHNIDGIIRKVWEWEEQYWAKPVDRLSGGDCVFEALVDSTFAIYDQEYFDPRAGLRALRVAGRFTARHLPWYINTQLPHDEEEYYRKTQRHSYYLKEKIRRSSDI